MPASPRGLTAGAMAAVLAAIDGAYANALRQVVERFPVGPVDPRYADLLADATGKRNRMRELAGSEDPSAILELVKLRFEVEGNMEGLRESVADRPALREALLPVASMLAQALAVALIAQHRTLARGRLGIGHLGAFFRLVSQEPALERSWRSHGNGPRVGRRPRRRVVRLRRRTRTTAASPGRPGDDGEPDPPSRRLPQPSVARLTGLPGGAR
jgi:hypothetical protein